MNSTAESCGTLKLAFGSANCSIDAPAAAVTPLRSVFARHITTRSDADIDASINVDGLRWHIAASSVPDHELVLANPSLLDVARALVQVIQEPLAARLDARLEHGIVLSFAGQAVIFEGAVDGDLFVLIAHLTARNWRVVATAASFVAPNGRLSGIQQLFSARPSMIPQVPVMYRGVIEMSPWYVAQKDIHFYAVEPAGVLGDNVWHESAHPRARVRIVPLSSFRPTLKTVDAREPRDTNLQVAHLALGDPIETADLFEHWWHAEVAGPLSA